MGEAIIPHSCRSSYGKITHLLLNLSNQSISAPACTEPMHLFFSWKSSSYNCHICSTILFHFWLFVFLHLHTNHQHDHSLHSNITSPGLYNWASWVKSGSKNAFVFTHIDPSEKVRRTSELKCISQRTSLIVLLQSGWGSGLHANYRLCHTEITMRYFKVIGFICIESTQILL